MTHLPPVNPSPSFATGLHGFLPRHVRSMLPAAALLCLAAPGSPALQAQEIRTDSLASADPVAAELLSTPAAEPVERMRIPAAIDRVELPREPTRSGAGTLTRMLDGRIPGLTVKESSGETGAADFIRLRGPVSVHGQEAPLLYVDGVRVAGRTSNEELSADVIDLRGTSRFDDIDPRDIASVQVLKGPAAAALYGGDADAGVLLVETRRGEASGPRITLSTEQGLTSRTGAHRDDYVNLTQGAGTTDPDLPELEPWRPVRNPVTDDVFARFNPLENPATSPFREGRVRSYGLTGRGVTGLLGYYASLRRDDDNGVLPNDALRRTRLRGNLDVRPLSSLELSVSVSHLDSEGEMPLGNGESLGILSSGAVGDPLSSYGSGPRAGESCLIEVLGGSGDTCPEQEGYRTATLDVLEELADHEEVDRLTGGLTLRWRPAAWLSGRFSAGVDRADARILRVVPRGTAGRLSRVEGSTNSEDRTSSVGLAFTASLDFGERISSSTTLGASYADESFRIENRRRATLLLDDGSGEQLESGTFAGSELDHDQKAIYLQQRFGYSGHLFLDLGARVDDVSERAGELNPVWSPRVGLSLVPSWDADPVDDFRVRAAWGRATRVFPLVVTGFADALFLGFPTPPWAAAHGEHQRTAEWDLGLDASFLDGRLSAALTHFRRITSGPVMIENHGVEALLDASLMEEGSFEWDLTLTLATRRPKVTEIEGGDSFLAPTSVGSFASLGRVAEGYAPGAIFGRRVVSAERDDAGRIIPGSVVQEEYDLSFIGTHLGNPEPGNEQGLATSLRLFDALRLHTRFDRAAGHVKMDGTSWLEDRFGRRQAFREAESTPEEQAALEGGSILQRSLYVHDADFVKWRSLTLSWDLPRSLTDGALGLLADARLTLGGRNLHTWTGYPGNDPEARSSGGAIDFSSFDLFALPPVRSWFARLSVSF